MEEITLTNLAQCTPASRAVFVQLFALFGETKNATGAAVLCFLWHDKIWREAGNWRAAFCLVVKDFLERYGDRPMTTKEIRPDFDDARPLAAAMELCLTAGRLLLLTGASGRIVHEAVRDIAAALGCDAAEVLCQHAAVLVTLRRGAESRMQMCKAGEHGVNLRRAQTVRQIIRDLGAGKIDCATAQALLETVPTTTRAYPVWFVCLSTGLACAAFGELLGVDGPAFLPIVAGSAIGQWVRQALFHQRHNVFVIAGIVSFLSAFVAGLGARLCGSTQLPIATIAAVLLLVPGVAVLNAQVDILEGKPNLAAARALRVLYLLLFMAIGLALAQALVLPLP